MRQYLVGSWNNADEYDYSGEQLMGSRYGQSREIGHFNHNGSANVSKYADRPKEKVKVKTAFESIALADRHFERLSNLSEGLDLQLSNGELAFDDYAYARKLIDVRLEKAWKRIEKARGWEDEKSVNKALGRPLDDEAVGYNGEEDKTLNWYDKVLTKGGFEGNIGTTEQGDLKSDIKMFLLYSILGCILIMYLAN